MMIKQWMERGTLFSDKLKMIVLFSLDSGLVP